MTLNRVLEMILKCFINRYSRRTTYTIRGNGNRCAWNNNNTLLRNESEMFSYRSPPQNRYYLGYTVRTQNTVKIFLVQWPWTVFLKWTWSASLIAIHDALDTQYGVMATDAHEIIRTLLLNESEMFSYW